MMKRIEIFKEGRFNDLAMAPFLVHESESMKVINFNFKAGQQLPIHAHDIDG